VRFDRIGTSGQTQRKKLPVLDLSPYGVTNPIDVP
jgi:hypothetical protein